MSADRWRKCPKCLAEAFVHQVFEETLREDYEIGTDIDGVFWVAYSAFCTECKFSFDFRHSENVNTKTSEGRITHGVGGRKSSSSSYVQ